MNRKNARGDAPMHLAAKKGNLNKIKSLLEKGADVNTQCFAGKATLTWAHFFKAFMRFYITNRGAHAWFRNCIKIHKHKRQLGF